jgi:hypothetical protein
MPSAESTSRQADLSVLIFPDEIGPFRTVTQVVTYGLPAKTQRVKKTGDRSKQIQVIAIQCAATADL